MKRTYAKPIAEVIVAHTDVVMAAASTQNAKRSAITNVNQNPTVNPNGDKRFNLWSDENEEDSKRS